MLESKYEAMDQKEKQGQHTSIWGSFWDKNLGWGYKCCKTHDKNQLKCKNHVGALK